LKKLTERNCPKGDKASLMYLGDEKSCYVGWYEKESKGSEHWDEFIQFVKQLNASTSTFDDIMNVDMVLWMHAFNNVLVNLDSYTGRLSHNYYMYKTQDGVFTPLVWDMNISFGGFAYDGLKKGKLNNEELQRYSMFAHYKTKNNKRPLITNLLANPLYRKIYVGHCKTILEENFSNDYYIDFAKKVQSIIGEEVKGDPNKLYSYEDFNANFDKSVSIGLSEIIGVKELMEKRVEYMEAHPLFNGTTPVISEPFANYSDGTIFFEVKISEAEKAWVAYRNTPSDKWQRVEMDNDGTGTWRSSVDGGDQLQYYFIAEGNRLATCSPSNASYKPYMVGQKAN
jgi:hypothetical protein